MLHHITMLYYVMILIEAKKMVHVFDVFKLHPVWICSWVGNPQESATSVSVDYLLEGTQRSPNWPNNH